MLKLSDSKAPLKTLVDQFLVDETTLDSQKKVSVSAVLCHI